MLLFEFRHVDDGQASARHHRASRPGPERSRSFPTPDVPTIREHANRLARIGQASALLTLTASPGTWPLKHVDCPMMRLAQCLRQVERSCWTWSRAHSSGGDAGPGSRTIAATAWPSTTGNTNGCSPCRACQLRRATSQASAAGSRHWPLRPRLLARPAPGPLSAFRAWSRLVAISATGSCSFFQRVSSAARRSAVCRTLGLERCDSTRSCMVRRRSSLLAGQDRELPYRSAPVRRRQIARPRAGTVADWLIATRAQAVSISADRLVWKLPAQG